MLGVEIDVSSRMGQNEIPAYFGVLNTVTCRVWFMKTSFGMRFTTGVFGDTPGNHLKMYQDLTIKF